jgi:3-phosphoshikimate 1-carboxyvinyltransferase
MKIKITKPLTGGCIKAIASKSAAHRLLICAALSDVKTRLVCSETSEDIDATARCLTAMGARIDYRDGAFDALPIRPPVTGRRVLHCGESGSTLRFMLPIAAALGVDAEFHMGGRLPSRPLSPLYEELVSHGCILSAQGKSPLTLGGRLSGGDYAIAGNISSQYISGLLFALPLLDTDSVLTVTGDIESQPYIDMTLSALRQFGISIQRDGSRYAIKGRQAYRSVGTSEVEGDWSNAAFWLCAGALLNGAARRIPQCGSAAGTDRCDMNTVPGGVAVTNLNTDSLQGDKAVLTFLERFGARVERGGGGVAVSPGRLRGLDIDAGDTPDLVPVLAAVAAGAEGTTTIYNAGRLRIKESDRLRAVTETLCALGADVTETPDGLVINGKPRLQGGTVHSFGDHRIVMSAAIASTLCQSPVVIEGAEAVNKSYPGFFADFAALGGCYEEVL